MEKIFMSAGIVVTIVLCFIGIVKLPFGKFKSNHPKLYKAVFTSMSIVLAVVLCVLDEIYILNQALLSFDFATLLCAVFAGVFGGYNGIYEGLGAKDLVKKIYDNLKRAKEITSNKKVEKYLNKILNNGYKVEEAIMLLEEKRNQKNNEV